MNREQEIRHLLWFKNEIIKQNKKELKSLRQELNEIHGEKRLTKKCK